MTIERAVVMGTLASLVQIRNMYTCEVIESGGDDSQTLWLAYMSSIFDELAPLTSTGLAWYEYDVQEYSAGSWVLKDVVTVSEAGSDAGDRLPFQNAITFVAKAYGLRKIGRKFLAGITEGYGVNGVIQVALAADVAAFLLAYITPFTGIGGGTITPGIVDGSGVFHPFLSGVVSSVLGSMRRRKPGIGI